VMKKISNIFYSGTPLRLKATGVEPHTHTKRRAGNFLWSVASGMARGHVRHTSVPRISWHSFMAFLHASTWTATFRRCCTKIATVMRWRQTDNVWIKALVTCNTIATTCFQKVAHRPHSVITVGHKVQFHIWGQAIWSSSLSFLIKIKKASCRAEQHNITNIWKIYPHTECCRNNGNTLQFIVFKWK